MPDSLLSANQASLASITWLLTDVDDTLTWQGQLPAQTLNALKLLRDVGVKVVGVTGACAGWCDQMAKLWPLDGVIGENGAFWMRRSESGFITHTLTPLDEMKRQQRALIERIAERLRDYPDVTFASDQAFRYCDVAVNTGQERTPLSTALCEQLLADIRAIEVDGQVVNATQSSIHINAWLGQHTKRTSSEAYLRAHNHGQLPELSNIAYVGDSLNDEGMFEWLSTTFGVHNIRHVLSQLNHQPQWITDSNGGFGFAELAERIALAKRSENAR